MDFPLTFFQKWKNNFNLQPLTGGIGLKNLFPGFLLNQVQFVENTQYNILSTSSIYIVSVSHILFLYFVVV